MYLSRLIVNPRDRAARRDLGDCQALHRTLLTAYPRADGDSGARAVFGVLYRVEAEPRSGAAAVLVQSSSEPDWGRLPAGYLVASGDGVTNPAVKAIDRLLEGLRDGMRLRFRLRANPTKKIDTKSGPDGARRNGTRVVLCREEDQVAWLRRKGEAGGFSVADVRAATGVADVRTAAVGPDRGRRANPVRGGIDDLTFGSVLFEGALIVTEVEAFRRTLAAGIGSGKAYGFGLLSVAPAGS